MRPLLWCNLFNRLNLNFRQNLLILLCLDYDNNTVLLAYFLSHSNSQTEYITDVQGYIYIPWCRWSLYCQSPKQLLEPVTFGSDDVDHLMNGHGPGIEGQRHFPFSRCSVPSNQALVYVCVVSYSFIVALIRADSYVPCTRNWTVSDSDTYLRIDTRYTFFVCI